MDYTRTMTDDKRERILDAAFNLFEHYGFLKTTVDEIAREAHVGKGTIYFYFKNKEDILISLTDREITKGFSMITNAVLKEPNASDMLKKLLQVSFNYFHNNKLLSKVMAMDQGLALSIIKEKNREFQGLAISELRSLLEEGHKQGIFREVDCEKVAYIIDSLIRSFHYLHYLGLDRYEPGEILDSCIDLLFSGIVNE